MSKEFRITCKTVTTACGISTVRKTETTTISISVVLLLSKFLIELVMVTFAPPAWRLRRCWWALPLGAAGAVGSRVVVVLVVIVTEEVEEFECCLLIWFWPGFEINLKLLAGLCGGFSVPEVGAAAVAEAEAEAEVAPEAASFGGFDLLLLSFSLPIMFIRPLPAARLSSGGSAGPTIACEDERDRAAPLVSAWRSLDCCCCCCCCREVFVKEELLKLLFSLAISA